MHVTVVSPEQAVFEGDAEAVTAPAFDGLVGILSGHAPFLTLLGEGALCVRSGGTTRTFQVRGGVLQVIRDRVRVVTEHAQAAPAD